VLIKPREDSAECLAFRLEGPAIARATALSRFTE